MEKESNLAKMLMDLANVAPSKEAIERLAKKWPGFLPDPTRNPKLILPDYSQVPEGLHHIIVLREEVRELWSRTAESSLQLESLLLSGTFKIGLRPFDSPPLPGVIGINWKRGELTYQPQTLLQEALHYLLRNIRNVKICGNPDCPAPFFIGGRSRYCSTDCSASIQAEAKRSWWQSHGEEWRRSRVSKKPKSGKKSPQRN